MSTGTGHGPGVETVVEAEVDARLAALDLPERVALLTGASFWRTAAAPRAGLAPMVLSDGPVGVRGEALDERCWSLCLPCPSAVAAAWDPGLARELGSLLATEARRQGVDVVLAPAVNLHRTPFCGRHFEYLSEDPVLTAAVATEIVRGIQDGGVGATVKHFVGNEAETERTTVDDRIEPGVLHELYLEPFARVVREARPWLVMSAYNGVNGTPMSASPLLDEPLTGSWDFDGVVVSDWVALPADADRDLVTAAARGRLGLLMPGPDGPWGQALVAAVERGEVGPDAVADKVRRLLRLAARVGRLGGVDPAVVDPVLVAPDRRRPLLRRATAAGTVLLHDRGRTVSGPVPGATPGLPLPPGLRRVAVLGPHAASPRVQGGGSARTYPRDVVSPLDGLRSALDTDVVHTPGAFLDDRPSPLTAADVVDGLDVTLHGPDGTRREQRFSGELVWPHETAHEIVVRTRLRVDVDGDWQLAVGGLGHLRLDLDGDTVLDAAVTDEEAVWPPYRVHERALRAGDTPEIVARLRVPAGRAPSIHVAVRRPRRDPDAELAHAVELARGADAAVVVVGTSEQVESEGFDRTDLALPGRQDELVRAVAAANPHTVVVLACGAPVLLPWLDDTAATLLAWFAGQECGDALADVLTGAVEPGGRLPTTWPDSVSGLPAVTPTDGVLAYTEGLRIGHRSGRTGRLPFGHGLGYTSWTLAAERSEGHPSAARAAINTAHLHVDLHVDDGRVRIAVTNTGTRPGRQVVQVYVSGPGLGVERRLAGFAAVHAGPGSTVTAVVDLDEHALDRHDGTRWTRVRGPLTLHAGFSAGHLPLSVPLTPDDEGDRS